MIVYAPGGYLPCFMASFYNDKHYDFITVLFFLCEPPWTVLWEGGICINQQKPNCGGLLAEWGPKAVSHIAPFPAVALTEIARRFLVAGVYSECEWGKRLHPVPSGYKCFINWYLNCSIPPSTCLFFQYPGVVWSAGKKGTANVGHFPQHLHLILFAACQIY